MSIGTIGILSPGEMGAAIGRLIHERGGDTVTCVAGRSATSRLRAEEAKFRLLPSIDDVVKESSILLSVLPPGEALAQAEEVVAALGRTGATIIYVDCNAVAPKTVETINEMITKAGSTCIDAAIIGGPPSADGSYIPRIYCSGPDTAPVEALSRYGLDIRPLGPGVSRASALKMVYAASTKGATALWTELLVAAKVLDVDDALAAEFAMSRGDISARLSGQLPSMPHRSRRWIAEMEEIASTFESIGLTPRILRGAGDIFTFVGETPLADLSPRDPHPSLETVVNTLADHLKK